MIVIGIHKWIYKLWTEHIELDNKRDCAFSIRLKGANEGKVILNYQFVVKYACVHNI